MTDGVIVKALTSDGDELSEDAEAELDRQLLARVAGTELVEGDVVGKVFFDEVEVVLRLDRFVHADQVGMD